MTGTDGDRLPVATQIGVEILADVFDKDPGPLAEVILVTQTEALDVRLLDKRRRRRSHNKELAVIGADIAIRSADDIVAEGVRTGQINSFRIFRGTGC